MSDGRNGRPPSKAKDGTPTKLTVRVDAETKNRMVDMAASYGLTLGEYLEVLVNRDAKI